MRFLAKISGPKIFTNEARNAFSGVETEVFNIKISRQLVRMNFVIEEFKITSVFRKQVNYNLVIKDTETNLTYTIIASDIPNVLAVINNALTNHCSAIANFKTMSGTNLKFSELED